MGKGRSQHYKLISVETKPEHLLETYLLFSDRIEQWKKFFLDHDNAPLKSGLELI